MAQETKRTVLLLETDASLRRLIALGLEYRGMSVIEVSSQKDLASIKGEQLDLLIVDIDRGVTSDWSLLQEVQKDAFLAALPVVVLGWECLVPVGMTPKTATNIPLTCLTKPFDARMLHMRIEQLLSIREMQAATILANKEATLLAAQAEKTASSIWPFMTAAGLLLVVIGLMIQLALAAVGIVIVLIALLWWTLGSSANRRNTLSVASADLLR